MKKNNGFTLVELLSAMVIIAIVLVILIPGILYMFKDVRRNTLYNKISTIEVSAKKYASEIKDEVKDKTTYNSDGTTNTCYTNSDGNELTIKDLIDMGYEESEVTGDSAILSPVDSSRLDGVVRLCYCKSSLDVEAYYAENYDANKVYHKGDKVIYNGIVYKCDVDAPAGSMGSTFNFRNTTTKSVDSEVNTTLVTSNVSKLYFSRVQC